MNKIYNNLINEVKSKNAKEVRMSLRDNNLLIEIKEDKDFKKFIYFNGKGKDLIDYAITINKLKADNCITFKV